MSKFNRLKDCVVTNKNILVRVDINVPVVNGEIEDDTRIKAVIPTLKYLAENKAKVILVSHFGRPEGKFIESMSLKQLAPRIQSLLGKEINLKFIDDCIGDRVIKAVEETKYGEIILLENLRFYKEETKNCEEFSKKLAALANLYVNDAFSCSHRAHASIVGVAKILKSCAGFLLEAELDNLNSLLENAAKPMMAVVGGAKVSTKFDLLNNLINKAESIVVGGGMANSFLFALDKNIGKSLCEKDLKPQIISLLEKAKLCNCNIILPYDVVVAKKFENFAESRNVSVELVEDDDIILDLGSSSIENLLINLKRHKTLVWNGPLGAFEVKPFDIGTKSFAKHVADLTKEGKLLSIAGGGDVVSAINSVNLSKDFSYISTAGGAFLEFLEGKTLPGVEILGLNVK